MNDATTSKRKRSSYGAQSSEERKQRRKALQRKMKLRIENTKQNRWQMPPVVATAASAKEDEERSSQEFSPICVKKSGRKDRIIIDSSSSESSQSDDSDSFISSIQHSARNPQNKSTSYEKNEEDVCIRRRRHQARIIPLKLPFVPRRWDARHNDEDSGSDSMADSDINSGKNSRNDHYCDDAIEDTESENERSSKNYEPCLDQSTMKQEELLRYHRESNAIKPRRGGKADLTAEQLRLSDDTSNISTNMCDDNGQASSKMIGGSMASGSEDGSEFLFLSSPKNTYQRTQVESTNDENGHTSSSSDDDIEEEIRYSEEEASLREESSISYDKGNKYDDDSSYLATQDTRNIKTELGEAIPPGRGRREIAHAHKTELNSTVHTQKACDSLRTSMSVSTGTVTSKIFVQETNISTANFCSKYDKEQGHKNKECDIRRSRQKKKKEMHTKIYKTRSVKGGMNISMEEHDETCKFSSDVSDDLGGSKGEMGHDRTIRSEKIKKTLADLAALCLELVNNSESDLSNEGQLMQSISQKYRELQQIRSCKNTISDSSWQKLEETIGITSQKLMKACFNTHHSDEVAMDASRLVATCIQFHMNMSSKKNMYEICTRTSVIDSTTINLLWNLPDITILGMISSLIRLLEIKNKNNSESQTNDEITILAHIACLHAVDVGRITDLLLSSKNKQVWKIFSSLVYTLHIIPSYPLRETTLLLVHKIRVDLLSSVDDATEAQQMCRTEVVKKIHELFHASIIDEMSRDDMFLSAGVRQELYAGKNATRANKSFARWSRDVLSKIQKTNPGWVTSFKCNGVYAPTKDGDIGTQIATISWIDVNKHDISFFAPTSIHTYSQDELLPRRHLVNFNISTLTLTSNDKDCAVTLYLSASQWQRSGLGTIISGDKDQTAVNLLPSFSSVNNNSRHSYDASVNNTDILSPNSKRLKIFVKRNEYNDFVCSLSRRGLTPGIEKHCDESVGAENFDCCSIRDRRYQDGAPRDHIEFSTSFINRNPAALLSIANNPHLFGGNITESSDSSSSPRVATSIQTDGIIETSPDDIQNGNTRPSEEKELQLSPMAAKQNNQERRTANDTTSVCFGQEICSGGDTTSVEKYQASLHAPSRVDILADTERGDGIETKHTQQSISAVEITPLPGIQKRKVALAAYAPCHQSTKKGAGSESQLSSKLSSLNSLSAVWFMIGPTHCNVDVCEQSPKREHNDQLSSDSPVYQDIARIVNAMDSAFVQAADAMDTLAGLNKELSILRQYEADESVVDSLNWMDGVNTTMQRSLEGWVSRRKTTENNITELMLQKMHDKLSNKYALQKSDEHKDDSQQ